jgi:hypothetical protein
MPTFDDVSKGYAAQIRKALDEDAFTKSASITLNEARHSSIISALKAIAGDLDSWRVDNQPLTEEQKERILKGASEHLNLPDARTVPQAVRNASNDAYMELVTDIGRLLGK